MLAWGMSEIHYFPRYSQPENVVTNNTLLLLLRLHQYKKLQYEAAGTLIQLTLPHQSALEYAKAV